MSRIQRLMRDQMPEARTFFQGGSMVDAVIDNGAHPPLMSRSRANYKLAQQLASKIDQLPDAGQVYIPQDVNYPGIRVDVDRVHAAELGLSEEDLIHNVITAFNSNVMIAPNYWVDYKSGNDYF
jgi:multidrug efflux pump subunit AcrB